MAELLVRAGELAMLSLFWFRRGITGVVEPAQEAAQKTREPPEQQADVLADAAKDGVETIAVPVAEEVAPESSVLPHVTDHRLDGEAAPELALDAGRKPVLLAGAEPAQQELALFNAHYDCTCFQPIHIFEAMSGKPILSLLRPGKRASGKELARVLRHVVRRIRKHWPNVRILVQCAKSHSLLQPRAPRAAITFRIIAYCAVYYIYANVNFNQFSIAWL